MNVQEIKDRYNSSTPPFFKTIIKYSKWVGWTTGIIAAGLTSLMTFGIAIPVAIPIILGVITSMSTAAGSVATLTKDDQINNTNNLN